MYVLATKRTAVDAKLPQSVKIELLEFTKGLLKFKDLGISNCQ